MIATPPARTRNRTQSEAAAEAVHQYARDVAEGRTIANRYVRLLCERHLRWLERLDLRFDASKAGRTIRFYSLLKLHEGDFEGKPFILAPWQAFIVGSIFGWYHQDEDGAWVRLIRNAYIETGKGSGKTPLAAGLGIYGMAGEGRSGARVFSAAPSRAQSVIPWHDAKVMIAKSDALGSIVKTWATSLEGPKESSFTYLSSEAGNLHGPRVYIAIIEEEHAHPTPDVIDAMRAGTKGWREALIFRITNSGYDRHSVCWADHQYSVNVLEGVLSDDAWFGFVAGLDMCDEHRSGGMPVDGCTSPVPCDQWTDEAVWAKANPNIGISLPRQYLREMVREAIGKPSQQSSVKRLCFCIWTEGSGKWLDAPAFAKCAEFNRPALLPGNSPAYGGLDLASTADLTAYAIVRPRIVCNVSGHQRRCYDLRVWYWIPGDNVIERVRRDHVPYDVWVRDGWITTTEGNRVDQRFILRDVEGSRGVGVGPLGIDRWNTAMLTPLLQDAGFGVIEVGQGFASLSAPAKRLEADIAAGLVHHDGNPVTAWMVANAAAATDPAGNIKPDREKSTEKIDGVAAWCDALFAWANAEPAKPAREPLVAWAG